MPTPTESAQTLSNEKGLQPQLSAGQMTMVAVGGSIGTGLLLESAAAIGLAGPAVILSFVLAALITWTSTLALGELASLHPAAGSFGLYADLYLSYWAGFLARGGYWAGIAVSIGAEMVAAATYMGYWFPRIPGVVWVLLFSGLLLFVNLRSVSDYGRFEYWFAMIKVVTIAAFVVLGAALLLSGRAPQHYTTDGGFFPLGILAPFVAMTFAVYTFGGVEFVAIASGESRSREEIGKAVRMTFFTLTVLYLGAIIVLVGIIPWNHAGGTESPFVTVFRSMKVPGASHLMNFVVLTAALSGSNAALYVSSRMLFSLARTGCAPARLGHLNRAGSPVFAVLVSSFGIVVALVLEKWAAQNAFIYILRAAFFGLILGWVVTMAAHIAFRLRLTPAQETTLPMRSPLGVWGSIVGLTVVLAIILKGWWDSRVNLISATLYLIILFAAYFLIGSRRRSTMAE